MDNYHLRAIILKLQDRLSDDDRKRLHFFLGNDVPRRIRDDPTLGGTLMLMELLFDRDMISEEDFGFLIQAFDQIQCMDAVKLLRQHERRTLPSCPIHSTQSLALIMPPIIDQILDDQDDKQGSTESFLLKQTNYGNNNNIHYNNNKNINPLPISMDTQELSIPQSNRKQSLCMPSVTNKCLLLLVVFLIIIFTLGILIVVFVMRNKLTTSVKQWENRLSEKNETIQQFNNQQIELEEEKIKVIIKAGRKFGGTGGSAFDDSLLSNFTVFYHLSGLKILGKTGDFDPCQFIYTSSHDNQSRMESNILGHFGKEMNPIQEFKLDYDDRINKVEIQVIQKDFDSDSREIIGGLKFITKKGKSIPPHTRLPSQVLTEEFAGYTLGYATGKTGGNIDHLRFFWYRTL